MKISTKGRYAMRAVIDLAKNSGNGPVQVKEISQRQEISEAYLELILNQLRAFGLVRSYVGAKGGFLLSRKPKKIFLIEIFQAVEGSTTLVDCVEDPLVCSRAGSCLSRNLWATLKQGMDSLLCSHTLQDLVDNKISPVRHGDKQFIHAANHGKTGKQASAGQLLPGDENSSNNRH